MPLNLSELNLTSLIPADIAAEVTPATVVLGALAIMFAVLFLVAFGILMRKDKDKLEPPKPDQIRTLKDIESWRTAELARINAEMKDIELIVNDFRVQYSELKSAQTWMQNLNTDSKRL